MYYSPEPPDIVFNGRTQALKQIKIIRKRGEWKSPWTSKQVKIIKEFGAFWEKKLKEPDIGANSHSLKCPNRVHFIEGKSILESNYPCMEVDKNRLYCFSCGYSQDWIPDWILYETWRK